jgi:hypothetical protein
VTKAQRQWVRRHAAMVALATKVASPLIDTEGERWSAVRRWRGDEAAESGEALSDIGRRFGTSHTTIGRLR